MGTTRAHDVDPGLAPAPPASPPNPPPPTSPPASPPSRGRTSPPAADRLAVARAAAAAARRDGTDGGGGRGRAIRDVPARMGRTTHRWTRLVHVYTSMIALVVVLFFAATGLSMNHPEWTFGTDTTTETIEGTFPFPTTMLADDGVATSVDYLSISEYLRSNHDVSGTVDSFGATNGRATILYRNPGYSADVGVDLDAGTFDLTVTQEGWVPVMNDMHKGQDTGDAWRWVIDVTAVFLVVISLTGLVMQFFLKKRRRSAFVAVGVGVALAGGLMAFALG